MPYSLPSRNRLMRHFFSCLFVSALVCSGPVRADEIEDVNKALNPFKGFATKGPETGVFVYAGDKTFTDKEMKLLASLKGLNTLNLSMSGVTDAAGKEVAGFKELKEFIVKDVPLGDKFAKELTACPKLTNVTLWNSAVTDAGLKELGKMKNLTYLDLTNCQGVTGKGVRDLSALTELKYLSLATTGLTNDGLPAIGKMTKLEKLNLMNNFPVTDAGIKSLAGLTNLKVLTLGNTGITDAGLNSLAGLKNLKELDLFGAKVTKKAVDDFKKAVPNCAIK